MFKSRRAKLPVLILTKEMQREAAKVDRDAAKARRDTRNTRKMHSADKNARALKHAILRQGPRA
jgi:hypothetical protein